MEEWINTGKLGNSIYYPALYFTYRLISIQNHKNKIELPCKKQVVHSQHPSEQAKSNTLLRISLILV